MRFRLNLTQKLIGFLFLTSVVPLLGVGVSSYRVSYEILRNETIKYTTELVNNQKDYLELQLQQIDSLIANISNVEEIVNALEANQSKTDTYTSLATKARIGYILNGYTNLKGLVSIDIFTLNDIHYHIGDTLNVSKTRTDVKARLLEQVMQSNQRVVWAGIEDNVNASSKASKVITAAKLLRRTNPKTLQVEPIGLLLVNYSVDDLHAHFSKVNLGEGAYLLVVDDKGRIIYHPDKRLYGMPLNAALIQQLRSNSGSFVASIDGQEMLISSTSSTLSNWEVLSLIPTRSLLAGTVAIRTATIFALWISFCIVVLAAWVVSQRVVKPIRQITQHFQRLQADTLHQMITPGSQGRDEIGELSHWFNTFLDSLAAKQQTEEALHKSEARHRALLNSMPDLILRISKDGVCLDCKPSSSLRMVSSVDEIIGKRVQDVLPEAVAQQRLYQIEQTLKTGKTHVFEYQSMVDGELRDQEVRIVVSGDDEVLAIVRDISERKRVEAEIQRQHLRTQLLAEITLKIRQSWLLEEILQTTVTEVRELLQVDRVLIYRLLPDGTGRVITESVVPACSSLLGRTFEAEVFPVEYHSLYNQGKLQVIEDLAAAHLSPCHIKFLQQHGVKAKLVVPIVQQKSLWGLMIAHQCYETRSWSSYEIELLQQLADQVGIALAQGQLLESLQQSEEKFRSLVEQTNDWVWEVDKNLIFTYTNPKVREILGYEPQDVVGSKIFNYMVADEVKRFTTVFEYLASRQEPFSRFEKTLVRKDHQLIILETSGSPVFDRQGNLQGFRGITRDITDRKQLEREIRQALAKEKEISELRSRFVSMVSHEFGTPLSTITIAADLLGSDDYEWTEAEKLEQIQWIQTAAEDMRQLLEDVLTIGRAEAKQLQPKPTWLEINEFCTNLIAQMQLNAGKHQTITFLNHCHCPKLYLDEKLLRQILINLLSNAVKYSPQTTTIQLELRCDDDQITIQVQDQGIGIPVEDQKRLFESFHRARNVGSISGTGLGLAIVKRCVEAMSGQISVSSEVGVGTKFNVTLPLKR